MLAQEGISNAAVVPHRVTATTKGYMDTRATRSAFGLAVTAVSSRVAGSGVPSWDASAFRAINGLPGWLAPIAWLPMQAGALASPIAIGAVLAWRGDRRRALRVAGAGVAAWGTAKIVKRAVGRGRPGDHLEGVELRLGSADVGLGFPSGHAAVAAGIAAAFDAGDPRAATALATLAGTVGLARIYVGAHYPLDVIGGWAMGITLGDLARMADDCALNRPPR